MIGKILRARPCIRVTRPRECFINPRILHLKLIRSKSSLGSSRLEDKLSACHLTGLRELWESTLATNPSIALDRRREFYETLRAKGLGEHNAQWSSQMISAIPRDIARLEDYQFALEVLLSQKDWPALQSLLVELSSEKPTHWEKLMLMLSMRAAEIPIETFLYTLSQSCSKLSIDLAKINRYEALPIIQMLHRIMAAHPSQPIVSVLSRIAEDDLTLATSLASATMRAITDSLVEKNRPPSPLEAGELPTENDEDVVTQIWHWKAGNSAATSDDLRVYMTYLVYQRQAQRALSVYDVWPTLHNMTILNEPLLLASASVGDYERLQSVFEAVERDTTLVKTLGAQRYAIVLSALGYLGDAGVLQGIYETLLKKSPDLLTRGVFHALIQSHGIRGDLKAAKKSYDTMVSRGVEPTYTTFSLVLQAYRDAVDLKGALAFVGKEMIDKYQFAFRNQELSLLLSLCGKRRDYKSAQYLWNWANTMIKPDRRSWDTYLHTFVSANKLDLAGSIFRDMLEQKQLSIVTLTIMMNAAGQSRALPKYTSYLLNIKDSLQIDGDEGWYTSLLSALNEWGDLTKFEQTFEEMKMLGIRPHASHYALYTELLTKTKQFNKYQEVSREMRELRVPLNFAYIEKHFRLLLAPGSKPESQSSAHLAAINLVRGGYFDPSASMVPRGAIPARVIEPVVRHLVKSGQFVPAKQLLDSLRKQRVTMSSVRDDFTLWTLYMEVAHASKNFAVIDKLWAEFLRALPACFSLARAADEDPDVPSTDPAERSPVFKVPRKYRYTFWRTINIRIDYLKMFNEHEKLMKLPNELDKIGLALNGRNINAYITALVKFGKAEEAFEMAFTAKKHVTFNISNEAKFALVSVVNQVKYHKYGQLGYTIRSLAKHMKS